MRFVLESGSVRLSRTMPRRNDVIAGGTDTRSCCADDIRKLHALKEELIMIELRNNFECHNPLPKWDVTWQPVDDIKQKDCAYPFRAFLQRRICQRMNPAATNH